ncbi:TSPO family protein [Megaselia abdita]
MLIPTFKILTGVLIPNLAGIKVNSFRKEHLTEIQQLKLMKQPLIAIPWSMEKYIWPALHTSIGYASYLVYKEGGGFKGSAQLPLLSYASHLAVSACWTNEPLKWSIFQMFIATSTAAFTSCQFFDVCPRAACMFFPYILWLTYYIYYLLYLEKINVSEDL